LKAAAVPAALAKGDWKAVLALDATNSEALRMQAAAITAAIGKGDWETVLALDPDNEAGTQLKAAAVLARAPITNSIGMTLNIIPAGTFLMGSPETEEGHQDDEHQHQVTITKPFYMQTTEVTQGQWKEVMGTEPWKGQEYSKYVKEGANYPATYVSWNDAVAYCEKLREKEGKTYRLPTEAEWEYACRAGTKTARNFGDDEKVLGDYAWYDKNAWDIDEKYAHQVGQKNPNAFGLFDTHGNVWEWCHDYYDEVYYKQSSEIAKYIFIKDPTGPVTGSSRVVRSGYWSGDARDTRSASRYPSVAVLRDRTVGFRLVRELD
jgi:formylglycine-generating enzyme required for sulfatase activity